MADSDEESDLRGLSYLASGRRADAAAEWRAVLEGDPDNRSARMYLAMLDAAPSPGRLA